MAMKQWHKDSLNWWWQTTKKSVEKYCDIDEKSTKPVKKYQQGSGFPVNTPNDAFGNSD